MDMRGLHFRLYLLFLLFTIVIVFVIGILQFANMKNNIETTLKENLMETGRSISSAYGSEAYLATIRSALNNGEYRVRTMTEHGDILVDTNQMSVYLQWPEIELNREELRESLNTSPGYFFVSLEDPEETEWVVYGQVLANWNGVREVLLVTMNTNSMKQELRHQMISLAQVACVIILAAFFICWLLTKQFLKPIEEITRRAELLAAGDYSVTFPRGSYTEIDTLAEVLDQSVQEFANYEQNRRNMIANVSHDMRTPLTMIKAYAEMIQTISGDNPQKRNEHLDVIISQSDKLSDFINATLVLSRFQAKLVELERTRFALDALVMEYILKLQMIHQEDYTFLLELDEDCMIHADYMRVEEVVNNLVSNAMKYGDGRVCVRVCREHNGIRLEIIDYGKGIPQDKLHLIWTRHYMVNPYAKDGGNSGVGLSIVKEIADLHGIEYGVESLPGEETRFWFLFPEA